ncbi:MAG: SDR family oxidoreductase [Anaerolineales bacterium]|uniref:SDR family oxidoreductase n=1 Tax=Candidatus Villigracilis proximus TaxID=3140683 RepID=UPI00313695D7|nr:SDR family oxidoreductase [Anaerolineales bacterium]
MARILITGASGLLGLNLAQETMNTHDITAVDRGKLVNAPFKILNGDLLNTGTLDSALDSAQPEWLINCAALADLEACENNPDLSRRLNIDLPAQMAKACKARGISFVHISTDAVFDGEKDGFYTEEDTPNPLGVYSQTKFDGEQAVFAEDSNAIVARVNFYGWSLSGRRSLAEFFHHNLTNNKSMSGFTDVRFCPMLVNDTARTLIKMLQKNLSGLYHVVGPQAMSKYQFGVEIARRFSLKESEISPKSILSSNLTARRSHNLWLSTHKLSTALGESLPEFSTGLDEFFTQYQQDYPQKIRSYAL